MTAVYAAMASLLDRLDTGFPGSEAVIDWACPIPYFGVLESARIATVGINPSNREFVDGAGDELEGPHRRLPTLGSLGLRGWSEADATQVRIIATACCSYFEGNPYDRWFRVLDRALQDSSASFYCAATPAVHLDLVPYATTDKWGSLPATLQRPLLDASKEALGLLIANSGIDALVLNGQSVVRYFQAMAEIELEEVRMPTWDLPRSGVRNVEGRAYVGVIDAYGDVALGRSVSVLGYNHNLQSSYGVTADVVRLIGEWLASHFAA